MVDARVRFVKSLMHWMHCAHSRASGVRKGTRAGAYYHSIEAQDGPDTGSLSRRGLEGRVGEGLPPSVFLSLFENQSPQDVEFATKYIPTQSGGELAAS